MKTREISDLVEIEIVGIVDSRLLASIRELLVTPYSVERHWDYGTPGDQLTCWTVLVHPNRTRESRSAPKASAPTGLRS